MAETFEARIRSHRRARARAEAAARFACPYCDDHAFSNDEDLWNHVRIDHAQQLEILGITPQGERLYRKLLGDEAEHKAKSLLPALTNLDATPRKDPLPAPQMIDAETVRKSLIGNDRSRNQVSAADDATIGMKRLTLASEQDDTVRPEFDDSARFSKKRQTLDDRHSRSGPRRARRSPPEPGAPGGKYDRPRVAGKRLYDPSAHSQFKGPSPVSTRGTPNVSSYPTSPIPDSLRLQPASPHPSLGQRSHSPETFKTSGPSSPATDVTQPPKLLRQPGVLPAPVQLPGNAKYPEILLQPESRPISQIQLAAEVKSIYAGLVMVENKCISVDKVQATAAQNVNQGHLTSLENGHWQALISLHRTLLHEHHDFFLASQHPSASPALQRLASKYSMPARMWKHGIHSFLELLRKKLPESLDYMLAFIYLSYQMVALLYETVPAFEETWIECLGDLGRYRMAIEDEDLRDRDTWSGVARHWYSKAADKNPSVGRLYHHLAILARPSALQQMFYYFKSLTSVLVFISARDSILTLLDPFLGRARTTYTHAAETDIYFIKIHAIMFTQDKLEMLDPTMNDFLRQLDSHIGRTTANWRDPAVYTAVTNIASLFGYGLPESYLRRFFDACFRKEVQAITNPHTSGQEETVVSALPGTPPPDHTAVDATLQQLDLLAQSTFAPALKITFSTFKTILQRIGDKHVLRHIHVILVFLNSLSSITYDCTCIYDQVPWEDLKEFLNTLEKSGDTTSEAELNEFPQATEKLPEDYLIRGQIWSLRYYPENHFETSVDEDERHVEHASTAEARRDRILYLGKRLAKETEWLQFDAATKLWSVNPSAPIPRHVSVSDAMEVDAVAEAQTSPKDLSDTSMSEDHDLLKATLTEDPFSYVPISSSKRVILKNYTTIVCETDMLLNQTDVFVLLLEKGDWRVFIPMDVIQKLKDIAQQNDALGLQAEQAIASIRTAIDQNKTVTIVDKNGEALKAIEALENKDLGAKLPEEIDEIVIGITRCASDLTMETQGELQAMRGAKPAVLVAENRSTRIKARDRGLTSVASSMMRKLLSSQRERTG